MKLWGSTESCFVVLSFECCGRIELLYMVHQNEAAPSDEYPPPPPPLPSWSEQLLQWRVIALHGCATAVTVVRSFAL